MRSKKEYDQLQSVINRLLDSRIIRRSYSEWSSQARVKPIAGKLDLVVNYSDLNRITRPINYEMPNIGHLIRGIGESSVFSKIVIKDGFHQIALEEESKYLTAFQTGKQLKNAFLFNVN